MLTMNNRQLQNVKITVDTETASTRWFNLQKTTK